MEKHEVGFFEPTIRRECDVVAAARSNSPLFDDLSIAEGWLWLQAYDNFIAWRHFLLKEHFNDFLLFTLPDRPAWARFAGLISQIHRRRPKSWNVQPPPPLTPLPIHDCVALSEGSPRKFWQVVAIYRADPDRFDSLAVGEGDLWIRQYDDFCKWRQHAFREFLNWLRDIRRDISDWAAFTFLAADIRRQASLTGVRITCLTTNGGSPP